MIRAMTIEDYEQVRALWMQIKGFAIRSLDDSRKGVGRTNGGTKKSLLVAVEEG